jgi:hypothetical protein
MKAGDTVRLIGIPRDMRDDDKMQTRTLFEECLGKTFTVLGMDDFEGVPFKLAKLDVGHVIGEKSYMHTIWVEEEYLGLDSSE